MKSIRIWNLALALLAVGIVPGYAQMKMDKATMQKIVADRLAKEAADPSKAKSSRRAEEEAAAKSQTKRQGFGVTRAGFQARQAAAGKPQGGGWGGLLSGTGRAAQRGAAVKGAVQAVVLKKRIKVITGNRVTDAVTGELLDDAREIMVDEEKKSEYFDDGTHGDLVAGDGQFTRITELTGVLGPNNQRIKEQLIQAVYEVSRLDAQEFYGHTLMAADHSSRPERDRRWAMVDNPKGGPGFRFSEVSTEKSVIVPSFWDEEMNRDQKIAGPSGWARTFLDDYRIAKGGLDSNFYTPYVPEPPSIPKVPPPDAEFWNPFTVGPAGEGAAPGAAPAAGGAEGGAKSRFAKAGGAAKGQQKVPSQAEKMASRFANRGAGAGSTNGGYFGTQ